MTPSEPLPIRSHSQVHPSAIVHYSGWLPSDCATYRLLCQAFLAWQHSTLCLCHQEYYALCPMGDALPKYQYVEDATI